MGCPAGCDGCVFYEMISGYWHGGPGLDMCLAFISYCSESGPLQVPSPFPGYNTDPAPDPFVCGTQNVIGDAGSGLWQLYY
jgi:hypothetical protein